MPASAGKVRMPANNRMQTSSSLNTHGIWQNTIGYDPYAADNANADASSAAAAAAGQSAYENMKGLLALARAEGRGVKDGEERGGWKGHGTLRGGWAAGKDLGTLPKEEPAGGLMPSSTSSDSDSEDEEAAEIKRAAGLAVAREKRRRERATEGGREKKEKKRKKDKKHKKSKHKKEKKEKKDKKRRRSDSD